MAAIDQIGEQPERAFVLQQRSAADFLRASDESRDIHRAPETLTRNEQKRVASVARPRHTAPWIAHNAVIGQFCDELRCGDLPERRSGVVCCAITRDELA